MFGRRSFRLRRNWVYRTDFEFTNRQLAFYRIARAATILFALILFFVSLYWTLKDFSKQRVNGWEVFSFIVRLSYCLAVIYPNRWINSNVSYNFKFLALECGFIWMLALFGNWLIYGSREWLQIVFGGFTVLLTWLAWFTTKARFQDKP